MSSSIEPSEWLGSWLALRAGRTPDHEAIALPDRVIGYGQLHHEVEGLTEGLRERGVARGDVVAALFDNGADWARLLWSLQELGAVLLPLNLRWVPRELAHALRDSGARWLLHGPGERAVQARKAATKSPGLQRIELEDARLGSVRGPLEADSLRPVRPTELDGILALLYTSGTTGPAKGALLSADAFFASAAGAANLLGTKEEDRWLVCLPLFHVGGLSILIRSCLAGSCAVIQPRFEPAEVARVLDEGTITGVSFVATMFERVLAQRDGAPSPPGLRCVLLGGGPIPDSLLDRALALGYPVAPTYGLTEAASQVATRPPGHAKGHTAGGLRALPGTQIRVVDETGQLCGPGVVGEICVQGPTLMRGYLGRPEETALALREGWLHTGDAGLLDEAGDLRVVERREDLIVSAGENIYPAEIEAVLESHPSIREAGIVAEPQADGGARPLAWCVSEGSAVVSDSELEAFCRSRLAGYKVPDRFHWIDALPRTASGKLRRQDLRAKSRLGRPG
ncbi:MAG: o-succinylbenzoate--CoA ligase [Myxococcota bacterium]